MYAYGMMASVVMQRGKKMKPVEEFIYRMKFNSKTMTVDVEQVGELIRCKDCNKKELCSIYRDARQELGFCAWAYRKEE